MIGPLVLGNRKSMHAHKILAVAALSLLALAGCGRRHKHPAGPPVAFPGTYTQSCRSITTMAGGFVSADCADRKGQFQTSYIKASACKSDLANNDGLLYCSGAIATTSPPSDLAASDSAASDDAAAPKPAQ